MVAQNQWIHIELKSGHGDSGPAWITRAELSKSGRTVYCNGRALKSLGGQGISGKDVVVEQIKLSQYLDPQAIETSE